MEENNENKPITNVEESSATSADEVPVTNTVSSQEQSGVKTETKDTTKNYNLKDEANEAKNFFINLFKTPLSEMKKIVSTPKSFLKITIVILVAWVIFECLGSIISIAKSYVYSPYYTFEMFIRNSISDFFDVFIALLVPVASVAALSGIICLLMKDKRKNYLTIASTIIIAKLPVAIASFISLLGYINSQVSIITTSFSDFCYVVSTVLVYFAIKALYSEEDDNIAAKTFLITMAIFFAAVLVLRFFNINICC